MRKHIIRSVQLVGLAGCAATTLLADFSYQQSSRITGGAMAAMLRMAGPASKQMQAANVSTVLVKGNRMAHLGPDNAQIIDLDKETITNISFSKKTYTVMTFEQMKQMTEQMAQRMGKPSAGPEANFKASVRETGKSKTIGGLNTTERILTLTMEAGDANAQAATNINTDMWLASDIPGYAEVRNFYLRMAEKRGWSPGALGSMLGARGMSEGMAAMAKEMSKIKGVPVLQVMTMSESGAPAPGTSGVTLEMTTESSAFSSGPVDASKFEVPPGFQQVDSPGMRRGHK